ncbi:murein hydrolase activator EnvC family protein [Autumnicola musiva]|uniref:M23 family metallopeptidase n=1 Tax=Autumnicola musiva TaxID=3075589 RepID=A0ABU3D1F2_9FLAO|nr:M23 family metallopeptidase [Zunongwangia sp. F117]MDT0675361.1 M23 family metallopeptidase [Zunongwangia sp. F117]
MADKNKNKFARKLLHKYRLVILNEDTFEEKLSFKLTKLNVFVTITLSAILLIAATTYIIAFTPLKEYIPGYSSAELKEKAANLAYTSDSLQNIIKLNNQYLGSIKGVLTGDLETNTLNRDSVLPPSEYDEYFEEVTPSRADSLLREEVAQEDKYNILPSATENINFSLIPPVKGSISEGFNAEDRHFAVDVVVAKNSPIKSVADGRVIFSEWTAETGYVIIVKHGYDLLSVYKHNASLTKEQGDVVRAGEVIATAGSTGEFTTGPHLHFELWNEGTPVDPTEYIDFN